MSHHEMELPHYIVIGHGLAGKVVERLKAHGFKRVIMITSSTPFRVFGSKVEAFMDSQMFLDVVYVDDVFGGFEGVVKRAAEFDVLLGVGGGRVLDVTKVLSEASGKPFFSIPTVASHDGIASPMTSYRRNSQAYSRKSVMPLEVLADMQVISMAPRRYLLSGCGDLAGKHSAVRDWWLSHRETGEYYGRYAAHLAYLSGSVVIKSAKQIRDNPEDGARTVVEALISAGVAMGVAGSSRPCSGSEHLIAHAIENIVANSPLHGERVGVATIFTLWLHKANWNRVKESLRTIGAPHTLKQINVDEDVFVDAVKLAPTLRRDRYTILHKLSLTRQQIVDILTESELV